ncbi:MAG: NAD-dependent epimerase/dehydratase family protein [Gaiellaceae bacterium]
MRSTPGRRALVTGGAGFVGGAVARRLVESGMEVSVLDDLSNGRRETVPTGATLVHGSVTDFDTVRNLIAGHSLIFHLAARGIVASTRNPREDFESNVVGTLNVLLAARDLGIERLVYSSSASIYGNPRTVPINEDDVLVPLSPYAASKLSGELYCLAFYESYGVPVAVVRYSNVYGPCQFPENPYSGVVTKFMACAVARRPMSIHGDGQQTRDFTFIDDAVDATLVAGEHPRAEGEVFNVGTGIETSVTELARAIGSVIDVRTEVEHIDCRDVDNIRRRVMNIEKIRRMLRWSPQTTLEAGLQRTSASFPNEARAPVGVHPGRGARS